ncbi:MAG: preprotein translocase subunit SecG [Bryobacteraceae bacterium]
MTILLTIVHIFVCFFLVIVVLLQSGKAADLAGAFGGMGSQTAFGPRGSATILSKATTIAAGLFMVTSLTLAIFASRHAGTEKSIFDKQHGNVTQSAPLPAAGPRGQRALPVQGAPAPLGPPSMTLTPQGGGPTQTIPITLPPPPSQAKPGTQQPATAPKK